MESHQNLRAENCNILLLQLTSKPKIHFQSATNQNKIKLYVIDALFLRSKQPMLEAIIITSFSFNWYSKSWVPIIPAYSASFHEQEDTTLLAASIDHDPNPQTWPQTKRDMWQLNKLPGLPLDILQHCQLSTKSKVQSSLDTERRTFSYCSQTVVLLSTCLCDVGNTSPNTCI